MLRLPIFILTLALASCAHGQPGMIREPLPAAEGTPVPLGKAVEVGKVAVEPLRIVEDSRCPSDAQCVWAGRLVLEANVAGEGWDEIVPITLGESHVTHGVAIRLVTATPAPHSQGSIPSSEYRFTFGAE